MAVAPQNKKRVSRPIFEGGRLRCPHDKQLHDVLSYKRFSMSAEFSNQLNVVLRCAYCGHLFSPALSSEEMKEIEDSFND